MSTSRTSSERTDSNQGEDTEDEMEGEDALSLHPDWDIDLEPGEGVVDDQVKAFAQQCVGHPLLTSRERKP